MQKKIKQYNEVGQIFILHSYVKWVLLDSSVEVSGGVVPLIIFSIVDGGEWSASRVWCCNHEETQIDVPQIEIWSS